VRVLDSGVERERRRGSREGTSTRQSTEPGVLRGREGTRPSITTEEKHRPKAESYQEKRKNQRGRREGRKKRK